MPVYSLIHTLPMAGHGLMLLEEGSGGTTPTAGTLAAILSDVGSVLTSMISWTGSVIETITGNPLLLLGVVGTFGLVGIGIVKRLLRL